MTSIPTPTRSRSEADRRKAFFYAEADASLYDAAADLNTPMFSLMHETMQYLVRQHREALNNQGKGNHFVCLDIGSGTGAESIGILKDFPDSRVVAFDLCEPMHEIFRTKAKAAIGTEGEKNRCRYLSGDIASEAGSQTILLKPIEDWDQREGYDLVISALTLHHLTPTEKKEVFQRIWSVLNPDGLFINGDIFTYQSPTMAHMANDFGLEWIRKQFTTPDPHLKSMLDSLGNRKSAMMESWLEHYMLYNLPDPIESTDQAGCNLQNMHIGQAEMLVEAGFSEISTPFRFWEVGIVWAKR